MYIFEYFSSSGIKPFQCQEAECNMAFYDQASLSRHVTRVHLKIVPRPFKCQVCAKRYETKYYLDIHMIGHTGDKPYRCSICAKLFSNRSTLAGHMKTHGEKTHGCSVCGKMFVDKARLKAHMVTHEKDKPYSCGLCGRQFARKIAVKLHLKRVHKKEN